MCCASNSQGEACSQLYDYGKLTVEQKSSNYNITFTVHYSVSMTPYVFFCVCLRSGPCQWWGWWGSRDHCESWAAPAAQLSAEREQHHTVAAWQTSKIYQSDNLFFTFYQPSLHSAETPSTFPITTSSLYSCNVMQHTIFSSRSPYINSHIKKYIWPTCSLSRWQWTTVESIHAEATRTKSNPPMSRSWVSL